jgi:hypothetical protein
MLNEEQIRNLLLKFKETDRYKEVHKEREEAHKKNSEWINIDFIKNASDDELRQRFLDYYRGGEKRQNLNQIYRDRIIRDISQFREMLLHLFDENLPIEQRFRDVVEGDYKIEGVGKALVSTLLMDFNIDKYCLWNNRTEDGLRILGWENIYDHSDDIGIKYVKILSVLKKLRDEIGQNLNLTFDDIDFFLHFISAEEEGIKLVQNLTKEEKEITVPSPEEKFIQKLIEENFNKILGEKLKLELYNEDPENSGVQYQTPVGKIDFLTKHKETGNFVVIELKRGKATDTALSQILRYMGWVQENLAEDKQVEGYILAEEIDDKLKYAIKFVSNVKVLTYKILLQIDF